MRQLYMNQMMMHRVSVRTAAPGAKLVSTSHFIIAALTCIFRTPCYGLGSSVLIWLQELNAHDALAWIAAQAEYPDLILLDCMMPGMSGHEFCQELRKTVPQSLVPVIMISAKNNEETIITGLQRGCNDFVRYFQTCSLYSHT